MEIEGKVIQMLPIQTGIGRNGNSWACQQFVIETFDQYPRKVIIDLFGEDKIKSNPVDIDDSIKVLYDLESREFNGRWYTSVRAYRVDKLNGVATKEAAPAQPAVDPFAPQPDAPDPKSDPFAQGEAFFNEQQQ